MSGDEGARAALDYELHIEDAEGWKLGELELTEALGEPYELTLVVHHDDPDAEPRELLGLNAEVLLDRGEHNRRVCGIVRRVETSDARRHHVTATLTVVPALWGLGRGSDSVIFQDKTVKDILEERLGGLLGPYGREVDVGGLERDYPQREYCVQYRESDLSFCHRLMEEEGIGYFFDFDGDGWERMVLFERNGQLSQAPTLDGQAIPFVARGEVVEQAETIIRMGPRRELTATAIDVRDYDWTQGQTRVEATVDGEDEQGRSRMAYDHGHGRTVSLFDFQQAGRYAQNDVDRQAEIRREALVRDAESFIGTSMVIGLAPGRTFEVQGHPVPGVDGEYLLTRVTHRDAPPPSVDGSGGEDYHNEFECIPLDVPWRPTRRTDKPAIYGVQTAVVTGGGDGEIHTDHYGRVQVLFHWDREGVEPTSCWIRVAQLWAGHDGMGYPGFLFIPRVGMEVVVTFVNGDPDRPLVTGAVYNGTNLPPEALPDEASRSMIRTRSLNGTGYNELSFEDAAGREEVHLRAERNLRELVQNDHATHVLRHHTHTVDGDDTETVGGDQELTVRGEREKTVENSERNEIQGDRGTTVIGNDELNVHANADTTIDHGYTVQVGGAQRWTVDQGSTLTVTGGLEQTIASGGWRTSTTGNSDHDVTMQYALHAGGDISMTTDASAVVMATGPVEVTGRQIDLTSQTAINVRAP
ncbi:MAG TPA: type VI secretion system tip protein TssI/VgrG, partial [Sandaracinaceae bacterium LLY-WYZ-13_1]|nr:type VI secretion system tip protein TssI/VgrG [Sandaracinaceae bacterium LLY-WYZ-13_1]